MRPNLTRIAQNDADEIRDVHGAAVDALTDLAEKFTKWGVDGSVLDMLSDAISECRYVIEHAEEEARMDAEASYGDYRRDMA